MKDSLITFIVSICIMPFAVALIVGMYKLTYTNDLFLMWFMLSTFVMVFMIWGYTR